LADSLRWRELDSNFRFRAIGVVSKLCRLSADLSCGEDALGGLGTARLEHLIGVEPRILSEQFLRERRY
jgi:hypothetical protein